MPATPGYADLPECYRQLGLDPDTTDPEELAKVAHVQDLDDQLSLAFDGEVRRSWRGSVAPAQRAIRAYCTDLLVLPTPVRSVTQVVTGGVWDGAAFAGGQVQPASAYYLPAEYADRDGNYSAIRSTGPLWDGMVLVTAVWSNQANAIPLDVKRALTLLVIGEYHRETYNVRESESGFDPVDQVPAPNPWNLPEVKRAIRRYSLKALVV